MSKHDCVVYDLPGDLHLVGKLRFRTVHKASVYLDEIEKEVRELHLHLTKRILDGPKRRDLRKYTLALLERVSTGKRSLGKDGLDAAMRYIAEIPHLQATLLKALKQTEASSRGGDHCEMSKGILQAVVQLLEKNPKITKKEAWDSFPESWEDEQIKTADGEYFEIYRDGEKLVQVCDRRGKERSITFRSFERFMTAGRKKATNS